MSSLDKSLDEILSNRPKKQFKNKKPVASKAKVGKAVAKPKTKRPTGPAAKSTAPVLDVSYATKVLVYNLPKDIKQDAVKDFFASQIGGVQTVALTYNEKGQSKGIATVIFKSSTNASKAVEKYNGAPIDGGSTKLKLELIIDPTKKPLASRILANAASVSQKANVAAGKGKAKAGAKPVPAKKGANNATAGAKKTKANKPKPKKAAKKTVEQLDQEMADYFEKKD